MLNVSPHLTAVYLFYCLMCTLFVSMIDGLYTLPFSYIVVTFYLPSCLVTVVVVLVCTILCILLLFYLDVCWAPWENRTCPERVTQGKEIK